MAAWEGTDRLTDITRGHIDGCILAHSANLIFAEKLADLGARVSVPTTINAISVDRENWRTPERARRLRRARESAGRRLCQDGPRGPSSPAPPILLEDAPEAGETIGWSESNAVIFANTVLGARHPEAPPTISTSSSR